MILHIENARLGNKLFQYVGLKKYFSNEKIFFFGIENTQQYFKNTNFVFFGKKKISRFLFYFFKNIIFFLIRIRIIGLISEDITSQNFKINIKRGLFWKILVSHSNFFQHKDVITNIENPLILKSELRDEALNWLEKKKINSKKNAIVFLHIRRGDYLEWPTKKFPAVLDISWYKRAMNLMQQNLQNPTFIIMSDDQKYLHEQFKETNTLLISNNKPELDLSLMSYCSAGILSPSSFAWWGAYYAKIYNKDSSYFLAPKYWIGHRSREWEPKNFYTKWITYVD